MKRETLIVSAGNCNLIYSKLYKKLGFNPANTNFYRYFEDVESDSEEPSSGTSLQFAPEAPTDATEYSSHQESGITEDDFEDQCRVICMAFFASKSLYIFMHRRFHCLFSDFARYPYISSCLMEYLGRKSQVSSQTLFWVTTLKLMRSIRHQRLDKRNRRQIVLRSN